MKFIWLLFSFTVVGLSIYPEPVAVGDVTLFFHSFWLSESLFVRANQIIILFMIFGWFREFNKYSGENSGRLAKRFFLTFSSLSALYIPWDFLAAWDNLIVKIILTVAAAFLWFMAWGSLLPRPTPEEAARYAEQKKVSSNGETQWLPDNRGQSSRQPNIKAAAPGEQLTSKKKPTISGDVFAPRDNQSVLNMGIRDLAGIRTCSNCGTDSTPYGKFCKECGSSFK